MSIEYDAFICHASEDKGSVARPLAIALIQAGAKVWFDELELKVGDSLSERIDMGLAKSRFGIVVLSETFFRKPWTKRELRGLVAREIDSGTKIILPVWHKISKEEVMAASPPLANVMAASTSKGISFVATQILTVVRPDLTEVTALYSSNPPGDGNTKTGRSESVDDSRLAGEYLVVGNNANGSAYRGRATIREDDDVVIIASRIGDQSYICQGRMVGTQIHVYGDFEVKYFLKEDGSWDGVWGEGGTEKLMPIGRDDGAKEPGDRAQTQRRRKTAR